MSRSAETLRVVTDEAHAPFVFSRMERRHHVKRFYGAGHLHFITFSCYRRLPLFATATARECFLHIMEKVCRQFDFVVVGCARGVAVE